MKKNELKLDTIAVQAGYEPKNGEPRVAPIAMSTTFKYDSAQSLADLFDLKVAGHFYTRLSNPTTEILEKKMAALEGGIGAIAFSSGQAASTALVMNLCEAGDHIVSAGTIYGGTFNLLGHTMKKLGIEVTFVDQEAPEKEILKAIRPNTKLIFGETLSNPSVKVLDIEKFARIAKKADLPLAIDNTFPTPALCRPFEFGANIVLHSLTKYSDGHACSMGGIIVDKGDYNFANGKFKGLSEPDESYHGLVYTKAFGKFAFLTKARTHVLRDTGAVMSPMNAWLTNMNLETLPLRMEKHSSNALALASFLEKHKKVAWINYPGLKSSPYNARAKKYLNGKCSGVFTFGIKGGLKKAVKFMDSLKLAAQVIHVADARTCVLHPASTTHRQLSDEEKAKTGILPELIRVSVGIENPADIIADFEQALKKC